MNRRQHFGRAILGGTCLDTHALGWSGFAIRIVAPDRPLDNAVGHDPLLDGLHRYLAAVHVANRRRVAPACSRGLDSGHSPAVRVVRSMCHVLLGQQQDEK
jgi:hypothetical protein